MALKKQTGAEPPVTNTPADASKDDPSKMQKKGPDKDDLNKKIEKELRGGMDANKGLKRNLYSKWKKNVELRLGEFGMQSSSINDIDDTSELQSEVSPDWYLTKTKIANLFSQVPPVQGTHEATKYAAAVPPFMKQLNYELGDKRAKCDVAMRETMADIVNAAGIGFVFVDYVARFEDVDVPSVDVSMLQPQMVELGIKSGLIPTEPMPQVVSDKFTISRIAPLDGVWPVDFVGSDFDDADFIGYRGRLSKADAIHQLELSDEEADRAIGSTTARDKNNTLRAETNESQASRKPKKVIEFVRLFYWRHRYDKDEMHLDAIWEVTFVSGLTEAKNHRPWNGQVFDEQTGKYVGAKKFPVRVGTITYVSDNPVPPSDSQASRPQTNDLRRSRSQLFQQRARSTPLRWFNVNQIGLDLQSQLMDGTFQGMIPVNGTGERAVGEISRANYPAENNLIDQDTTADMLNMWGLTPGALGLSTPGRKTQAETAMNQAGFATNIGSEKLQITKFFLGIVEVVAGMMSVYSDFGLLSDQELGIMNQTWDRGHVTADLVLKIRPDSMIALDPQMRIQRLFNTLNMTVKSGFINPKPIITEIIELSGIDPNEVVIDPTPPQPEPPKLTFSFSGKDDLMSPAVMAILLELKKAPDPQSIAAAKKLLQLISMSPEQEAVMQAEQAAAGGGAPQGALPPGAPAPKALPPHPNDAAAHGDWSLASKIAKRSRDMNAGNEK